MDKNIWIRLESYHDGCTPVGVYQDFDYYLLNDFCGQVMCLPVPKILVEDGEGCFPTFWFTNEGWEEYGQWFKGLFEPEALSVEGNITVLVSIIKDTQRFHPLYKDEYQVALCYEEAIWVTSSPKWKINSLDSWEQFERELFSLMRQ